MLLSQFRTASLKVARLGLIASGGLVVPAIAQAQATGILVGTVTDSVNARPLTGARITVIGLTRAAATDNRGQYRIEGLSAGDYTISASATGRESARRLVHVTDGGSVTENFSLGVGSALLSQVVVSATRSPLEAKQIAATIHVMPAERVRTSPARTTDDMLREIPGLELPRTSSTVSGPEEIVSIRGADEGRTLVMLDNVPLNDPWGEWIQWNRAPRFQLDHVEVLEGGGSSLYGNYAMGGVISLFSHPIIRRGYSVMASGGSRSAADVSLYGSDVKGPLGYSISGDYGTGGGYDVIAPNQRGPVDQASSVTRRNMNARAEYAFGSGSSLFGSANYFSDDRSLGTPLTEPNQRQIVSGALGGNFGSVLGGSLEARGFAQTQKYDSRASRVNQTRTAETPLEAQNIPSHDLGGSAQWSRPAGIFENVSVGGDFRYMTGSLNEALLGGSGALTGTRSSGGSQEVGGIFVQAVLAPIDPLRIEASARVDGWRSYNGSRVDNSTATPTATIVPSKTNAAFAPRLGVRYALLPTLALRGSFYQAFRAPTLSEEYRTFFAGPNTFLGNPALTPEYLTGYDGGLDWQPIPMIELRATAFLNKYRDLDDFAFKMPGATLGSAVLQRQNLGAARSKGFEGELAIRPLEELSLVTSYNYNDARVTSTGKFINRVPLQRATARLTYDAHNVGTFNAIYRYEGPNHALGGASLKPFAVMDLDVRREVMPGAELFVAVENVFDRQYAVNFSGPLESIGLPRTVRSGITLRSF